MRKMFRYCEKCKRPLIERLPNGLWVFVYGRRPDEKPNSIEDEVAPIVIKIHGSVKMKCFRKDCREKYPEHWNIFHYFPEGAVFHLMEDKKNRVNREIPTDKK